ncbi:flagellar hook-length control protein FliK (plasmid) [Ralstonia syzygii]|uniref:Flagellar hook-length control protein FliK n=1 Tax=Ralstonia syzygii TaxID=28097 RepID=A0ABX7ZLD6_9RALS|nr:flagellar hook-length control protein FliK [Ralstonia syzygii]QUP56070.1 flagellar hook-length control protein FliK [Ralstonia syzygii]
MGLSATPNTAATDLGAMLSAASTAADKSQTASSGADTFGNLLSDRLNQEAARRQADAQSASSSAAARRTDTAKKDAAKNSAASNDQGTRPADRDANAAPVTSASASATQDAQAAKPTSGDDAKDKTDAAQAAVDPAAQLAAQIEAARQAAQQATAPAPQPGAQAAAADAAAAQLAAGKAGTTDAAALAALSAANAAAGKMTDPAAAVAQPQAAQAEALKAAVGKDAQPTSLPDANAFAQTLARTRASADNTPAAVRRLGSTSSSAQGAGSERGNAAHRTEAAHGTQTQTTTAVAAETGRNADTSGNTSTQADAQGAGAKFDGVLTRASGDAAATAPTFAVGGAGTAGSAAGTAVAPAQTHTLPTFGDAAWPHTMASQLAYMQVHRQSSAELQLSPAELGGLHVKLEVDNGAVNASFVCQHQAVAELVQDAMPRLRDAMQQGGMQLAQTSVSTGDFSQQGASQGSSAQGNGTGGGSGGRGGNRFAGTQGQADTGTVAVSASRVASHAGAIDTFA